MTNVFDQFDPKPGSSTMSKVAPNVFDQFDAPRGPRWASLVDAAVEGAEAPLRGATQLIGRGVQAVTGSPAITNSANNWQRASQGVIDAVPGGKTAALIGDVASPLNFLPVGDGVRGAALLGAGLSAMQPVDPNNPDYWHAKAVQALTGAAAGGVFGGIAHGVGRLARGTEGRLVREGVKLTTGETFGRPGRAIERGARLTPARMITPGQQARALNSYQPVIYRWVLAPMGVGVKTGGPIGQDGIAALQQGLGDAYGAITQGARITVRGLPNGRALPMTPGEVFSALGVSGAYDGLPSAAKDMVEAEVRRDLLSDTITSGKHGFSLGGAKIKDVQTALRASAREFINANRDGSHPIEAKAGHALNEMASAITDKLGEQDPARAEALRRVDASYRRLTVLERAVRVRPESTPLDPGIVTPDDMVRAIRGADKSARHRQFAAGLADGEKMFQDDARVLTTPRKADTLSLALGLGEIGTGLHVHGPLGAALVGAGTIAPFTAPASAAARALVRNPANAARIAASLRPFSAAAGAAEGGQ